MPNRRLKQFQYSYQQDVVTAYSKVTYGSSGAPTLAKDPLFSAVTRNGAGDYTFTMRDRYVALLNIDVIFNTGSSTAPAAPQFNIQTDSSATATPSIRIVFRNVSGTATDPASGEIGLFTFIFRSSSVAF